MAVFFGSITSVRPKAVIAGQPLIINIDVQTSKPEGIGAWQTFVDVNGNGLAKQAASPIVGELWATRNWSGTLSVELGTMPNRPVPINVKLWAGSRMQWPLTTSVETLQSINRTIDVNQLMVPIEYSDARPSTVEETVPEPSLPKPPEIEDMEKKDEVPFDWKWVVIGGVVLLALTMTSSGKK